MQMRPALSERLKALAWTAPAGVGAVFERIYEDFENELPDADLAGVGLDLVRADRSVEDRVRGCV